MKRNILLVGGSYGIGKELSTLLQNENHVFVASRTSESVPAGVTHLQFDVRKDDISTLDLPDRLDGFVYCPGSINLKPFRSLKPEDILEDLDINFMGMVRCLHGVLNKLKRSENPSLVFFSTVAVKVGMPFHTSVAAAKGAIEGFARSMAAEFAPKFRVNVIAPSLTDTPLADKLLSSDDKRERMDERHPLKRIGNVSDIAEMAAFLLNERSSWMTGQVLGVDGGMSTLNVN